VRDFLSLHRALVDKHARTWVRVNAEKISAEDIAREIELEVTQLEKANGLDLGAIAAPDAFLRSLVKHACGRAKRRRKLIEQVAAGDDLEAVSEDLAALDSDLPEPVVTPTNEAREARRELDKVKAKLSPRDALVYALLVEDDGTDDEVARALSMSHLEIADVGDRIAEAAESSNIPFAVDDANASVSTTRRAARERQLRRLAHVATDEPAREGHTEEPILALLRHGDQAADLEDAIVHVAHCAGCRARLTEGHVERKSVVVVAIEAPRASQSDLQKAAEGAHARLVERGEGRFVAVVDAAEAEGLKQKLEKPESSVVSRLAIGTPFEVPVEELHAARERVRAAAEVPETGTDAAEVSAWAQVARKPKQKVPTVSPGWTLFAAAAIVGAVAIAYVLATR